MIKKFEYILKFFLLFFVSQLLVTSCFRQIPPKSHTQSLESQNEIENQKEDILKLNKVYRETSSHRLINTEPFFRNIAGSIEKEKLEVFIISGIEKVLDTGNTNADEIIETAQKYLGVPHCMGGTNMKCIDCSGLLVAVFNRYGIHLPHNSEEQARYGKLIAEKGKLLKGDLVFFIRSYESSRFITHSGIFIGNNNFIHTSSKSGVAIASINDRWWGEKFIFGTRIF